MNWAQKWSNSGMKPAHKKVLTPKTFRPCWQKMSDDGRIVHFVLTAVQTDVMDPKMGILLFRKSAKLTRRNDSFCNRQKAQQCSTPAIWGPHCSFVSLKVVCHRALLTNYSFFQNPLVNRTLSVNQWTAEYLFFKTVGSRNDKRNTARFRVYKESFQQQDEIYEHTFERSDVISYFFKANKSVH